MQFYYTLYKKVESDPWVFCLCGNTLEQQVHLGSSKLSKTA